jgi:hypothetical protein
MLRSCQHGNRCWRKLIPNSTHGGIINYISLEGRIVLLNSVPIFYLYFLKMPVKVIKKVVCVQRRLLWGGVYSRVKKICWVK